MIYALVIGGYLQGTYPTEPECEMAANKSAGDYYQSIQQWGKGKSLKKEGGEWQVVVDREVVYRVACQPKEQLTQEEQQRAAADKAERGFEQHRAALWSALQTRVLTDDEMREVLGYGDMINITPMVSYYADQKAAERTQAFQRQILLRQLAVK